MMRLLQQTMHQADDINPSHRRFFWHTCTQALLRHRQGVLHSFLILCVTSGILTAQGDYLSYQPKEGESISYIIEKFQLGDPSQKVREFFELNQLKSRAPIFTHRQYKLPIKVHSYNGQSIRSTLEKNDWDLAVKVQNYNLDLYRKGVKSGDYREDRELWVPTSYLKGEEKGKAVLAGNTTLNVPLFGSRHAVFPRESEKLKNKVFYLVSGHGGPDPGAISYWKNSSICEDEYSYDVTLRLAKLLMAHGAIVEVIIQDPKDGIRSGYHLPCDQDEVCITGQPLPLNQLKRLQQRTQAINDLYINHRKNKEVKEQIALMIHVDSRAKNKRQDVYFYHLPDSDNGREKANNIYRTFRDKYKVHRSGGRYHGSVSSRNLYMLRATYPPAVFIELGNLKNPSDQKRIILESNRQALAQWIFEGLVSD